MSTLSKTDLKPLLDAKSFTLSGSILVNNFMDASESNTYNATIITNPKGVNLATPMNVLFVFKPIGADESDSKDLILMKNIGTVSTTLATFTTNEFLTAIKSTQAGL